MSDAPDGPHAPDTPDPRDPRDAATPAIVPRWEWRTFGETFGPAEDGFAAMGSTGTADSDETYLLTEDGDTVKIRGGLMDIKVLRAVGHGGLERWEPVLKTGFPMSAQDARVVARSLRIDPGAVTADAYELDAFLDEVAQPAGVRVVPVHKHRVRYAPEGTTAEVSDVVAEGRSIRTIAIESPDPDAVLRAVDALGLSGFVNTSYPRGLLALLADHGPRFAVIDIGTNSVKFHVAQRNADESWDALVDRAEVTRLGEGIAEHGVVGETALKRTLTAIGAMANEARDLGARAIVAVGTAGLRAASNRDDVLATIRERTGVVVEVIPGDEEGRLSFLATKASHGLGSGSAVVFETGGGSTQVTVLHEGVVEPPFSIPIGAVAVTERFGLDRAVSAEVVAEARAFVAAELAVLADRPRPDVLLGMGGAVTNLAAVHLGLAVYDPEVVDHAILHADEIDRQIERYRGLDADGRRSIVGLQPARAEVILAGACIVRTVMDLLRHDQMAVSDRGLRHGLLVERFGADD